MIIESSSSTTLQPFYRTHFSNQNLSQNHIFPSPHLTSTDPNITAWKRSLRSPRQKGKSRRAAGSPGYAADSNLRRQAGENTSLPGPKRWVDALKCVVKEKRAEDPGFASNNKKWNLLDVLWVQNGQMDHSSFCDTGCQEGIRKWIWSRQSTFTRRMI